MGSGSEFLDWFIIAMLYSPFWLWLIVYRLRHKHTAFRWLHKEFFLNGFWRTGMRRLMALLRIIGVAAAMHMYFSSPSDNERHYKNFMNNS